MSHIPQIVDLDTEVEWYILAHALFLLGAFHQHCASCMVCNFLWGFLPRLTLYRRTGSAIFFGSASPHHVFNNLWPLELSKYCTYCSNHSCYKYKIIIFFFNEYVTNRVTAQGANSPVVITVVSEWFDLIPLMNPWAVVSPRDARTCLETGHLLREAHNRYGYHLCLN